MNVGVVSEILSSQYFTVYIYLGKMHKLIKNMYKMPPINIGSAYNKDQEQCKPLE